MAEGGGFFKREGYALDTVDLTTGPRPVAAIMGGSVDIAPLGLKLVVQATSRSTGTRMFAIKSVIAARSGRPRCQILIGAIRTPSL